MRGSGPNDERIAKKEGKCWTARVPRLAAGTTTKEMYVDPKPISTSEDYRKEDRKEHKVSGTSTLHLAAPSVASCGSSAQHNCCEV